MTGTPTEQQIKRSLAVIGRMFQELEQEPDELTDITLQLGILLLRNTRVFPL
jgi:hypothetical protein